MKKYEIKTANSNEPTWAPLAKELAPILIYEDINQEFPTSIFFDGDRNMSNNGEPKYKDPDPLDPDSDGDSLSDWEEVNGEVTRYAVDMGDKGYLFYRDYPSDYAGTYTIRTFTYHTDPLNPDTDDDGQNDYNDPVPLDYDMDGDGVSNSDGHNKITMGPDGKYDTDGDGTEDDLDNDDDNDGMTDVYEQEKGVSNGGWQDPLVFNARYALLIGGGFLFFIWKSFS